MVAALEINVPEFGIVCYDCPLLHVSARKVLNKLPKNCFPVSIVLLAVSFTRFVGLDKVIQVSYLCVPVFGHLIKRKIMRSKVPACKLMHC